MKKLGKKNKTGFTLMEIVLVIAIIIILSGVLLYGLSVYITSANNKAEAVSSHDAKANKAEKDVASILTSNPSIT